MAETGAAAQLAGQLTMVDSAYPLPHPPPADITLIYAAGDTPHPATAAEIAALTTQWLWPCFVRSNPATWRITPDVTGMLDWLAAHKVPKGTAVILDLETAVHTAYVTGFDQGLTAGGYKVTKYGSMGYIWKNPKTSGGTFVAAPGVSQPVTMGDTVATQYEYDGPYDLSWVLPSVPLWPWKEHDVAITQADLDAIGKAVGLHTVDGQPLGTGVTVNGALRRTNNAVAQIPVTLTAIQATLANIQKNLPRTTDPAAVAAAVISQLAAGGFSADEIAGHILAGLPDDLAGQVVTALAARLEMLPALAVRHEPAPVTPPAV